MNKVLLINKPINYTSRDVVNILVKKFNTKKIGHFGTLDPLAEGLLVVGIGSLTKLDNYPIFYEKEYIAEVLVGKKTTTYDVVGDTLEEDYIKLDKEQLEKLINSFNKTYMQEVPIYSSVKVNGKKLYEYAREKKEVVLPKKEVTVKNMHLLDIKYKDNKMYFTFKCKVSKGTYIRSLINDMGKQINIPFCMSNLKRVSVGKFNIKDAYTLKDIENDNYRLLGIKDVLDLEEKTLEEELIKKVLNGQRLEPLGNKEYILFKDKEEEIALYKKKEDYMSLCFFFK